MFNCNQKDLLIPFAFYIYEKRWRNYRIPSVAVNQHRSFSYCYDYDFLFKTGGSFFNRQN